MANQHQNNPDNPLTDYQLEVVKIYHDTFKHMMTFCSGAILLTSSVVAALFPKPVWLGTMAWVIGLFVIALAAAVWGLQEVHDVAEGTPLIPLALLSLISVIATYAGALLFAIFVVRNLGFVF